MNLIKFIFVVILSTFYSLSKSQSIDSERVMINEINLVRTNPKLYKEFIIDFVNNNPNYRKINETNNCVREILAKLDTMSPLNRLYFNKSLYMAISDNSEIDTINQTVNHDFNELVRIQKYDKSIYVASENIIQGNMIYSFDKIEKYTMRECIIRLLIDWGIPDRSHRNTILDPSYNVVAVKGISMGNSVWYVQEFTWKDWNN